MTARTAPRLAAVEEHLLDLAAPDLGGVILKLCLIWAEQLGGDDRASRQREQVLMDLTRIMQGAPLPGPVPATEPVRAADYTAEVPENVREGEISFTAELELLGQRRSFELRYSYVGEFGHYPRDFAGFGMLGSVSRIAVVEDGEARAFDFDLLDRAMLDAIDARVVAAEAAR